jgi:uncharacterized protein (TIGR02996 family)
MNYPKDRKRLESHLDASPGDFLTRAIYADLLEEEGEKKLSDFQRYLIEKKLYPDNNLKELNWSVSGWKWWSHCGEEFKGREHALLPLEVQEHFPEEEWLYETRQEAELHFYQALERMKQAEGANESKKKKATS